MPNGTFSKLPSTQQNIRNLSIQSGEPFFIQRAGQEQARTIAENTPAQKFMMALMQMLTRSQQIEPERFERTALGLEAEQARRLATLGTPGIAPNLQAQSRAAAVGALEPSITGARAMERTISGQLRTFESSITAATNFMRIMEEEENRRRDDARSLINDALDRFGGDAFKGMDPKRLLELESVSGYGKGYISDVKDRIQARETIKEREMEELRKFRADQISIQRAELGIKREALAIKKTGGTLGTQAKNALVYINGARATLSLLTRKMAIIPFPRSIGERLTLGNVNILKSRIQSDPNMARFEALKKGIVSLLARAKGEVGVLTEQDIQRVIDTLPRLNDRQDVAYGKLQDMLETFNEFEQRITGMGVSSEGGNSIFLQNPQTGEMKQFTNIDVEDLEDALNQGFLMQ